MKPAVGRSLYAAAGLLRRTPQLWLPALSFGSALLLAWLQLARTFGSARLWLSLTGVERARLAPWLAACTLALAAAQSLYGAGLLAVADRLARDGVARWSDWPAGARRFALRLSVRRSLSVLISGTLSVVTLLVLVNLATGARAVPGWRSFEALGQPTDGVWEFRGPLWLTLHLVLLAVLSAGLSAWKMVSAYHRAALVTDDAPAVEATARAWRFIVRWPWPTWRRLNAGSLVYALTLGLAWLAVVCVRPGGWLLATAEVSLMSAWLTLADLCCYRSAGGADHVAALATLTSRARRPRGVRWQPEWQLTVASAPHDAHGVWRPGRIAGAVPVIDDEPGL